MGSILKAVCKCGFEKEFLFGAGMMDFETVCNVPAINKKTGEFTVENYFNKDSLRNLNFYTQPEMYSGKIIDDYHEWGEVLLKATGNFCPKCKNFTLAFEEIALFD